MKNKHTAVAVSFLLFLLVLKTISLDWGMGICNAIFIFYFYKQNFVLYDYVYLQSQ